MSDYINDKELEEINEMYRQKLEANKKKPYKKSASKEKKPAENNAGKSDVKKSSSVKRTVKVTKQDKIGEDNKPQKKPAAPADDDKKKKLGIKINIGVCSSIFAVLVVALAVLPRPTVSETEKRELAKFPEFLWENYWKGDYTEDISYFYNDTVPFRDELKSFGAWFRSCFGFSISGEQISGNVSNINSGSSKTEITTQSTKPIVIVTPAPSDSNSSTPQSSDDDKPQSGDDSSSDESKPEYIYIEPSDPDAEILHQTGMNTVYLSNDVIYGAQLYNGKRSYAEDYANSVNLIKERLPDVNVYSMLAVTQNTFITPKELNTASAYSELSDSRYLSNMLSSDIKVIETFEALFPHINEEIFFLRDCHWQQLGAYYAAESFANTAGVAFPEITEYDKYEEDCLGSIYTATDYEPLMYEGETFTYYVPTNDYQTEYYDSDYEFQFEYPLMPQSDYSTTSFYSLFMVADNYIKHITTDVDNDRVLVVLKDDYPSAMIPCLTSSFEEIYVIDVRYCNFNVTDFCAEMGATDVLVGMTTENALGNVGTYLEYILNL